MGEQLAQQGQGRLDPVDRALERGPARLVERAGETAVAVGDDLGDEGVEGPVDPGALDEMGVDPHPGAARPGQAGRHPVRGQERAVGADPLGRDAQLDRRPSHGGWVGQAEVAEGAAGGERELGEDEVDPRDQLRHGVLDLQARVDLDEPPAGRVVGVEEELHGRQPAVPTTDEQPHGGLVQGRAHVVGQVRCGRDLDDLLEAALEGAVALAEVGDSPFAVGRDLHLDVARALDVELGEEVTGAEAALGLRPRPLDGGGHRLTRRHRAHAPAAATGRGLDHHAAGQLRPREVLDLGDARPDVGGRQDRHAGLLRGRTRPPLVAEELEQPGVGADEGHVGVRAGPRQLR